MRTPSIRALSLAALALSTLVVCTGVRADTYPTKPIRIIVPFPAGGVADLVIRTVGQKVGENLKQPVVVENKPGASAIIGSEFVARAAPDGYTLLVANLPVMSINSLQYADLPYSPAQDFAPVVMLADQPYIIGVSRSLGKPTMQAFIDLARNSPTPLTFGSASSSTFLAGELFKQRAQVDMTHVPYKGSAPAINDLLGGHISLMLDPVITLLPHVKADKIAALAVTSPERLDIAPEIPSYTEVGLKDLNITSWQGVVAPAKTPKDVIQTLNREFNRALQFPEVQARLKEQGVTPVGGTPEDFEKFIDSENKRWSELAKQVDFLPVPR